jgi:hypothetical protein
VDLHSDISLKEQSTLFFCGRQDFAGKAPWLLGSLGTVSLDFALLIQVHDNTNSPNSYTIFALNGMSIREMSFFRLLELCQYISHIENLANYEEISWRMKNSEFMWNFALK